MEKSLSDILRGQHNLSEVELLLFARSLVKNNLQSLTINQLDRVYKLVREIAAENGAE